MGKMFTPGKWKKGRIGSVVSDSNIGISINGGFDADAIRYYGGYLICESVSDGNASLIQIAPEMYRMLKVIAEKDPVWGEIILPVLERKDA